MRSDTSSSKLLNTFSSASNINPNSSSNNTSSLNLNLRDWDPNYEEIVVTIKKSERGFGFELRNGVLITAVYPSKKI
jgi:hypothetical protein